MGLLRDLFLGYAFCYTKVRLDYQELYSILYGVSFPCGTPVLDDKSISFDGYGRYRLGITICGRRVCVGQIDVAGIPDKNSRKSLRALCNTVMAIIEVKLEEKGILFYSVGAR